jgi:hypothetical protein
MREKCLFYEFKQVSNPLYARVGGIIFVIRIFSYNCLLSRDVLESRSGFCALLTEVLGCFLVLYIHTIKRLYLIHGVLYFYSPCISVELH